MSTLGDKARKLMDVVQADGTVTSALATEDALPIKDYDKLTAEEIVGRLRSFSQAELRTIDAYERKNQNRTTITDRVAALSTVEPWQGYDDSGVGAIKEALGAADVEMARAARAYERDHKDRTGVIEAADRRIETG